MAWTTSSTHEIYRAICVRRALANLPPLKFYADKIYNTDEYVTGAWNARHGVVHPWTELENLIMSKIRVAVEWSFGKVKYLWKKLSFKISNKLLRSPITEEFVVASFMTNCRTCLYWDGQHYKHFGVKPPTLEDYLDQ